MKKHYFLGLAAGKKGAWRQIFTYGTSRDCADLKVFLQEKYGGEAILTKNGRSALALALKANFKPGDGVIVNGFTCYAVYEAVKAAGLKPIWADISRENLNFSLKDLDVFYSKHSSDGLTKSIRGIIIQNTLGNPVDMVKIEKFAKKHNLKIIEDLAHCAGVKYPDGREAGTVGAAAILSFGKDKSIDTTSGGALILREPGPNGIKAPSSAPKLPDNLRARFYPLFGNICRGLSYVHLGGALMRLLVRIHWVEKSADNKLDLNRKISKFEAKLALKQLKNLKKSGEKPLREFYLVKDRDTALKELKKAGYHFAGFWYEKPVSPERYYRKVKFPEEECPVATEVAAKIINFPTYYSGQELEPARKIIKGYLDD